MKHAIQHIRWFLKRPPMPFIVCPECLLKDLTRRVRAGERLGE